MLSRAVLQTNGAGPYTPNYPDRSVDQYLTDWIVQADSRFRPDIMG